MKVKFMAERMFHIPSEFTLDELVENATDGTSFEGGNLEDMEGNIEALQKFIVKLIRVLYVKNTLACEDLKDLFNLISIEEI